MNQANPWMDIMRMVTNLASHIVEKHYTICSEVEQRRALEAQRRIALGVGSIDDCDEAREHWQNYAHYQNKAMMIRANRLITRLGST